MVEFSSRREAQTALVTLRGTMCADEFTPLREELRALVKAGAREIRIDMTDVDFIDSAGIGLLAAAHNSLVQRNGRIELTGVRREIYTFFTELRLHTHFRISPRTDDDDPREQTDHGA